MGKLHRLELENFKSYAGKQVVGPFDNFSCIIGPNGAGKSNMMDAISFVLGVQSRHLRSTHLRELIYRGDSTAPPSRRSSVLLVYQVSDGEVEGLRGGSKIYFSRSISSAGVSSYRLNDRDVAFEVYESMLKSIGVLVKTRNFLVFQGDVESVAAKSPADLSKLLEQISESDQYREEYEELARRKEESDESTRQLLSKKKMYTLQCKEAKAQKDEADDYQSKWDSLNKAKSEHVLLNIWRVKTSMEENKRNIESFEKELQIISVKEENVDFDIQKQKEKLAALNKGISKLEKNISINAKELESVVGPDLAEIQAKLRSLNKRLSNLRESEDRLVQDRNRQVEQIKHFNSEIGKLELEEGRLRSQIESEEGSELHLGSEKVKEYTDLRLQVSASVAAETTEENTLEQEHFSKQQRLARIGQQEQVILHEIESESRLIAEYTDRSERLKKAIADGVDEMKRKEQERAQAATSLQNSIRRGDELAAELADCNAKLREVGDQRRRSKQEERINEAIETMKRIFPGVHGKLEDLCSPIQKRYALALAVTAGKHMDAIVVDTIQVAKDCIGYLKDQRIGTCSFLPLNNINAGIISDRYRSFGDRYRLCVDLVSVTNDAIKPAVQYALGDTIVCENLDDAQHLCFQQNEKVKVVTVSGQVISRSGAMTGGIAPKEGQSSRWEEKDSDRARRHKQELEEQLAENKRLAPTRQAMVDLETEVKTLSTRLQFSRADADVAKEKLDQLHQQRELKRRSLDELLREGEAVRSELQLIERRRSELADHIRKVENEIFKKFSKSVNVENIREYEGTKLKKHQELISRKSAILEQLSVLKSQLEYERKRDFKGAIDRLGSQIQEIITSINEEQRKEDELRNKELKLRLVIENFTKDFDKEKRERNSITVKFSELKNIQQKLLADKESWNRRISGEEILVDKNRQALYDILQKAQVDEVSLPSVPVSSRRGDNNSVESALIWTGNQLENADVLNSTSRRSSSARRESLKDGSGSSMVDLSGVAKYEQFSKQRLDDAEQALEKHVNNLQIDLESMQPNMHATERFENLLSKLDDFEKELNQARKESSEISARYDEVKRLRQERYRECYHHVSDALGVIYKDLTRSSKHPLGGNAYLTLDNTEEPYLGSVRFTAMPPMKRFRDIDQLSGGEKTIAALALLFSIHSFRQAPFFVLDEVDAALDNVNVKKVCNYIQQRSKDFQCIVISLKDIFFEHADCLIGICKDVKSCSSRVLTLDLKQFAHAPIAPPTSHRHSSLLDVASPANSAASPQNARDDEADSGNSPQSVSNINSSVLSSSSSSGTGFGSRSSQPLGLSSDASLAPAQRSFSITNNTRQTAQYLLEEVDRAARASSSAPIGNSQPQLPSRGGDRRGN